MILGLSGVLYAGVAGPDVTCDLGTIVCTVGSALGFPAKWLNSSTFLWYSFTPLMGVWLIIFGFLDRIHIFRRNSINGLLSFLIAFSTIPLGVFVIIVSILFSIMGMYSVILFVGLFFIGTYYFAKGYIRGWKRVTQSYDKAITAEQKVIDKYQTAIDDINTKIEQAQRGAGPTRGVASQEQRNKIVRDLFRMREDYVKQRDGAIAKKRILEGDKKRQEQMFQVESKA